eukprot:CAMPEP_0197184692 /NCGR_PEP_ID=MMETSP1423-20130617/10347_1 /TAXON_ID=476441 /ORGANISM="Pseudo-nitzschia heimii, Strain UNC1101" /LENGTH=50 /DNA_ID=CAMNT_0042635573 /DNA_START=117 /DNA_END=266 /DNA_ORIENTATION=-
MTRDDYVDDADLRGTFRQQDDDNDERPGNLPTTRRRQQQTTNLRGTFRRQ